MEGIMFYITSFYAIQNISVKLIYFPWCFKEKKVNNKYRNKLYYQEETIQIKLKKEKFIYLH